VLVVLGGIGALGGAWPAIAQTCVQVSVADAAAPSATSGIASWDDASQGVPHPRAPQGGSDSKSPEPQAEADEDVVALLPTRRLSPPEALRVRLWLPSHRPPALWHLSVPERPPRA
jgi:hypothetical protein